MERGSGSAKAAATTLVLVLGRGVADGSDVAPRAPPMGVKTAAALDPLVVAGSSVSHKSLVRTRSEEDRCGIAFVFPRRPLFFESSEGVAPASSAWRGGRSSPGGYCWYGGGAAWSVDISCTHSSFTAWLL